jgi:DNA-binding transcriptional ArsR family regulator
MNTLITPELAADASNAAKSLSHSVKVEILGFMAREGDCSPSQVSEFVGETGASLGVISYHMRQLAALGAIELSHTTPRRGALEHHYKISRQGKRDLSTLVGAARLVIKLAERGPEVG